MDTTLTAGFYIFSIISILLFHIGLWKLFEKAGIAGWKAFVPFYNYFLWIKLIGKKSWWIVLLFIPVVNLVVFLIMAVDLAKCFGRDSFWAGLASMMVPYIYFPYLGFSPEIKYEGTLQEIDAPRRSGGREWADAIAFAVIAATLIRTFFFEAYTIPTTSMESTLLAGDFLFVSKFHYGARIPMTPVAFPFAHHTMPVTKTKAYIDWIKLPYMRLPGFQDIKRNDIVVFNFPEGDTVWQKDEQQSYYALQRRNGKNFHRGQNLTVRPIDKKENYIKRCVAIPGDSLRIRDRQLFINGTPAFKPEHSQFAYQIIPNGQVALDEEFLEHFNINESDQSYPYIQAENRFVAYISEAKAEEIKNSGLVSDVQPFTHVLPPYGRNELFPNMDKKYGFSLDNYGPIVVPEKGKTIRFDSYNYPIYKRVIEVYEKAGQLSVSKDGRNVLLNGQPIDSYTFQMDYYFMMGDNRHRSLDSRYWGFVPADHVVGKAWMVWWSWDVNTPFPGKLGTIRWNRVFKPIH